MRGRKNVSISLPKEIFQKLDKLSKQSHQSRSEFIKNTLLNHIVSSTVQPAPLTAEDKTSLLSLSEVLKLYYDISAKQKREVIIVGLGIISKANKVLIGKRGKQDPFVKRLSWVFPGGQVLSLRLAEELKEIIKAETGLDVTVGRLVHARLHPDNLSRKVDIVALYFHCLVKGGKEKQGQYKKQIPLAKLKWIEPTAASSYFTTSTADEVMQFLKLIELGEK